jgi:rhodanese-related sulfurtransferase
MFRTPSATIGGLVAATFLVFGFSVTGSSQPPATLGPQAAQRIAKMEKITPEILRQIQASPEAAKGIVLIDVRSSDEWNVSIIPGAITKEQYEANVEAYAGRTVVAYCLSGGRSGSMVRKLKARGVPAVDLEGSILGWCHKGLPLTTLSGKPTHRVFTYSSDNTVPAPYEAVY